MKIQPKCEKGKHSKDYATSAKGFLLEISSFSIPINLLASMDPVPSELPPIATNAATKITLNIKG